MKRITKFLLLISSLFIAIICAEIYLRWEQSKADNVIWDYRLDWTFDQNIGRLHTPGTSGTHSFKVNDKLYYNSTYVFDKVGRRKMAQNPRGPKKFIAAIGSSTVVGQGLENNETWLARLANLLPNYQVYNYGVIGLGPQSLPGLSQRIVNNKEIRETEGLFVYYFTFHHLKRLLGTISVSTWTDKHLHLSLNKNGALVNHGYFESSLPWRLWVFQFLKIHSKLLGRLGIDYPFITNSTYELMIQILLKTKSNLESHSPKSKFIVMINDTEFETNGPIMTALEKYKIPFIVMNRPDRSKGYRHDMKYDGHENIEGSKLLAKRFKDLALRKKLINDRQ